MAETIVVGGFGVAAAFLVCYSVIITVAAFKKWKKLHFLYYLVHPDYTTDIYRDKKMAKRHKMRGDHIEVHIIGNWPT